MEASANIKSRLGYLITGVSTLSAIVFSIAVSKKGILWGEIGLSRWMYENTPAFIDSLGDIIDAPITDIGAPLLFIAISLLVFWRWGDMRR